MELADLTIGTRVRIDRTQDCRWPWAGRWRIVSALLRLEGGHEWAQAGRTGTVIGIDRALESHQVLVTYDEPIVGRLVRGETWQREGCQVIVGGRFEPRELVPVG